ILKFRVYSRRFSSGRNSTVLELTPTSVTYTQKYTSHAILCIKKYTILNFIFIFLHKISIRFSS
ncbi:hypothetical protein C2G38_2079099, partial [Gigaspora rosea]